MSDASSDSEHPAYGMLIDPRTIPDTHHIQFHCHRETLMEAISACMNFVAEHDLETPDINTDYEALTNPHNGKQIAWYEANVSARLPEGSTIAIVTPKEKS